MSPKNTPPFSPADLPPPPEPVALDGYGEALSGLPTEEEERGAAVASFGHGLDAAGLENLTLEDLSGAPPKPEGGMHPAQAGAIADARAREEHLRAQTPTGEEAEAEIEPESRAQADMDAASEDPVQVQVLSSAGVAPAPRSLEARASPATSARAFFEPVSTPPPSTRAALSADISVPPSVASSTAGSAPGQGLGRRSGPVTAPGQAEPSDEVHGSALAALGEALAEGEALVAPSTLARDHQTGAHAVVAPPGQSGESHPRLELAHVARASPAPVPGKIGLFSADILVNSLIAACLALIGALYVGEEVSGRVARDSLEPLLLELEDSINAPLDARAGKLREPGTITAEISLAEDAVQARYFAFWLGSAAPLGLLLGLLRRRPRV